MLRLELCERCPESEALGTEGGRVTACAGGMNLNKFGWVWNEGAEGAECVIWIEIADLSLT